MSLTSADNAFMRDLCISVVPPEQIRNSDVGDWFKPVYGVRAIYVSDFRDYLRRARPYLTEAQVVYRSECYALLIGTHELTELHLCIRDGVTQEAVDNWDAQCDDEDPGLNPAAPYHKQHVAALAVEQILARELGVDWEEYNDDIVGLTTESDAKEAQDHAILK